MAIYIYTIFSSKDATVQFTTRGWKIDGAKLGSVKRQTRGSMRDNSDRVLAGSRGRRGTVVSSRRELTSKFGATVTR